MKKNVFALCLFSASLLAVSCSDNNTQGDSTSNDTTNNMNTGGDTTDTMSGVSTAPITGDDATFVMEAAMGSAMEIQTGNLAQQNAGNQRVKDFGSMMIADHGKASNELKSLVGSRMMLSEELPADKKKHMDEMSKMKGKSFDRHYMDMMVDDHKKTIDLFEKQSKSGTDPQLKNWAAATLPVLQKHYDSAQAIKKNL